MIGEGESFLIDDNNSDLQIQKKSSVKLLIVF